MLWWTYCRHAHVVKPVRFFVGVTDPVIRPGGQGEKRRGSAEFFIERENYVEVAPPEFLEDA